MDNTNHSLILVLLLGLATCCGATIFGRGKSDKNQQMVPYDGSQMQQFQEWQQSQHYQDYMNSQQASQSKPPPSSPKLPASMTSSALTIAKPTSESKQPNLPKASPFQLPRQALEFKNNDNNPFHSSNHNDKGPLIPSTGSPPTNGTYDHRNHHLPLVPARPGGGTGGSDHQPELQPYRRPVLPQMPTRPKPSNALKIDWKPEPKFFEPPQYYQPERMPMPAPEVKKKPPTEHEVRKAYKELFVWSDNLDSDRVLRNIDTLDRWEGGGLEGKIPIPLGRIEDWSRINVENCKDYDMMKDMQSLLNNIVYEHQYKAFEKYVRECLNRYRELCNFEGGAVDSFDKFKTDDEERWEMLKLWNYKVGQFGKRHTKWGKSDHSTNTFQLNEALTEICEEHGGDRYEKYKFGYRMVTALRVYCDQMSQLKGVLGATTLRKDWKRDAEIKEFHKLMSVCVQTQDANYLKALGKYV